MSMGARVVGLLSGSEGPLLGLTLALPAPVAGLLVAGPRDQCLCIPDEELPGVMVRGAVPWGVYGCCWRLPRLRPGDGGRMLLVSEYW